MTMLPEQQQRILGYFIEEARDHLNTIEQGLLSLQSTLNDPETINEVFRAAHSIKGGAAMLGLSSIQRTAHRLEDCFKILKEQPVKVDQKLESLFLGVSDTLKALLEHLSGPFGLTDEIANNLMSEAEPVFQWLHEHLDLLVKQEGGANNAQNLVGVAVGSSEKAAVSAIASKKQDLQQMQNGALQILREMLQLFKQTATVETRSQLQNYCQKLVDLGDKFQLSNWCDVCSTVAMTIANPKNSYLILAKTAITEIKQALELVSQGRDAEIVVSQQLSALVGVREIELQEIANDTPSYVPPEEAYTELNAVGETSDDLFAPTVSETSDDLFAPLISNIYENPLELISELPSNELEDDDPSSFDVFGLDSEEDPPSTIILNLDPNGPEVGIVELTVLDDLFGEDTPEDLDDSWEEEEIVEAKGTAELGVEIKPSQLENPDDSDLADLLAFDENSNRSDRTTLALQREELTLVQLFGDFLDDDLPTYGSPSPAAIVKQESNISTPTNKVKNNVESSDADIDLDFFDLPDEEEKEIPVRAEVTPVVETFDNLFGDDPQVENIPTEKSASDQDDLFNTDSEATLETSIESSIFVEDDIFTDSSPLAIADNLELDFKQQPLALEFAPEFTNPDGELSELFSVNSFGELELDLFAEDTPSSFEDFLLAPNPDIESDLILDADNNIDETLILDSSNHIPATIAENSFNLATPEVEATQNSRDDLFGEEFVSTNVAPPETNIDASNDFDFAIGENVENFEQLELSDDLFGTDTFIQEDIPLVLVNDPAIETEEFDFDNEPLLKDEALAKIFQVEETYLDLPVEKAEVKFVQPEKFEQPEVVEEARELDLVALLGTDETPNPIDKIESDTFVQPLPDEIEDFASLEALLQEESPLTEVEVPDLEFDALEALLNSTNNPTIALDSSTANNNSISLELDDEFSDLQKLLDDVVNTIPRSPTTPANTNKSQRTPGRRTSRFEETMRVPVKHLDDMSNMVGELVVNRNTLEQDQERLRQSLDNLLVQVQQLSDVGARMQELYERSLLEASLLASRKNNGFGIMSGESDRGFNELEMDRFTPFHTLSQEMIELIVRVRESASDIEFVNEETERVARQFRQVTTQLQEGLTRTRMVPFTQVTDRLQRGVRDNAIKCGKQVILAIEGGETLIDKMILEHLTDPLTHMLNNAIAHGIETPDVRQARGKDPVGTIVIRAFHQGNQTVISVGDDGAGIDTEKVKAKAIRVGMITNEQAKIMTRLDVYDLLFQPGFSIRDKADELSGRGVGMDVVRSEISEIRGAVSTDSTVGKGTTFTIRLPLTLSICKALCCVSDKGRIAFPMDGVEDTLDIPKTKIQESSDGQLMISWRDTMLQVKPLRDLLTLNRHLSRGSVYGGTRDDDMVSVVVVRSGNTLIALQVDQVLSEQEIVIKQFEAPAPKPIGVAGATILGDGRIMPIADVLELIDLFHGRTTKQSAVSIFEPPTLGEAQSSKIDPTVLIVDDSITVRELLSLTFDRAGYRVEQARDGQEAWDKLRSGLPCDIVFCDIEMPRCDGLELLSRIQKDPNLNNLPIAMLTSRGADKHRQMAIQLGASGYFTKPYLEEALLDAAQRMLKGEKLVANSSS